MLFNASDKQLMGNHSLQTDRLLQCSKLNKYSRENSLWILQRPRQTAKGQEYVQGFILWGQYRKQQYNTMYNMTTDVSIGPESYGSSR